MSTTARADIKVYQSGPFGSGAVKKCNVAASATLIYPGDPVGRTAGTTVVSLLATNRPVVATDFIAGIAQSISTNTAAAAGTVDVLPLLPGMIFLIKPNSSTSWDTQAEYDALVGKRVLLDLTSTTYTILAADGSTYGCVIEALDVATHPGVVAFSFRDSVRDLYV